MVLHILGLALWVGMVVVVVDVDVVVVVGLVVGWGVIVVGVVFAFVVMTVEVGKSVVVVVGYVVVVDGGRFGVFSFIVVGLANMLTELVLGAATVGVCLVSGIMVVVCSGTAEWLVVDLVNDVDNNDDGEVNGNGVRVDDGSGNVVLVSGMDSEDSVGIGKDQEWGVIFGVESEDDEYFVFGVLVTLSCLFMSLEIEE